MPPIETVLAENADLKSRLSSQASRIAELEAQIAWFRRQVFAGGKSERADPAQLELMLKGLEAAKAQIARPEERRERKAKSPRRSREEMYGDLPILEESVIEPEEVEADPDSYGRIGEEETFEVKVDPPRFYRRPIVRPRYRRIGDRQAAPLVAPAPPRVVEGLASAQLLSHVVVSKYLDHLPLHRQSAVFKRRGLAMPRQNLVRWVEKVAEWLKPIYDHMRRELLGGDYLQVDETPVQHCDPDYGESKSRRGYLCGYSRPGGAVCYKWSPSRSHASVTSHLAGFAGALQADMYEAYPRLADSDERVELAGCWAHARRKLLEIKDRHPRGCAVYLKLVARLYAVEREIRDRALDADQARRLRQEKSTSSHARIKRVLTILRSRSLPASELAKARDYSLRHWKELSVFLERGCVQIDNNAMENAIRPTAVGKKNWLFVGHPQAGDRAAILYSILITCQRLDVDPYRYLQDALTVDTRTASDEALAALTPEKWKSSQP